VDESIASYRTTIELDPKNATPTTTWALRWRARVSLDEAIDCYKKAVELDPKNATARTTFAVALAKKAQKK